jgi:hypothetical protein
MKPMKNVFFRGFWLILADGSSAVSCSVDTDSFPIGMIEIEHKKILVRTDQAKMTKGKNVVISNDLHNQMIKPHNPKIGVWKETV